MINPLQKQLACYISGFQAERGNAYTRLFRKLKSVAHAVSVATLNYDLLIEQALLQNRIDFDYNGVDVGRTPLLKLHGSSNFLPELGTITLSGNRFFDCAQFVAGMPTNAVGNRAEIVAWCADARNSDISPVLAMYEANKRIVVNSEVVERIQRRYAELVRGSTHLVIVGTSYVPHDEHVWKVLGEHKGKMLIVDPFPSSLRKWMADFGIGAANVVEAGFSESVWEIAKFIRAAAHGG